MLSKVVAWVRARTPRQILLGALALFLLYSWPGFIGWDTREHMIQARAGVYTDGHPPAVARLVRLCELFVAGPALLLLIQAVTLLVGLYLVLKAKLAPRTAAIAAAVIFLFPYVSGVQALIAKDGLMAGFLMIAIALLLDERRSRQRWALVFVLAASLMRWNALAATFAPMLLFFRWRPGIAGVRRYAIAVAVWLGVTAIAFEANELLTTKREYLWYWSYAYEDIAGTLGNMPPMDDAQMEQLLAGLPLRYHDHLYDRFKAKYNPASHYHLMRGPDRLLDIQTTEAQRVATSAAWNRIVLGNPGAYLRYRLDNFRLLVALDRPPSFSNVYVWFNVIAAPEVIAELDHDAAPSRIQAKLIDASIWISLSPLYFTYLYFGLCFVLVPFALRVRLEAALILSAIGYELQWFFLAATADLRYSQWMAICTLMTLVLVVARYWRPSGSSA